MHGRGSEVRRERGAPLTGAARMHSPPAQSDGRPDAECNADSVESLVGFGQYSSRGGTIRWLW